MSITRVDIGPHTLYRGDLLEALLLLEPASIAAVITDPPYSSGGMVRGDRMATTRNKYQSTGAITEHPCFSGDNRDQRSFAYWCAMWLAACRAVAIPGGMLCTFTDWRQLPCTTDAVQAGGWVWRGIVPWDKQTARPQPNRFRSQCEYVVWATNGPRDHDMNDTTAVYGDGLVSVQSPPMADREHTTQKPVDLMRALIPTCAKPDEVVLDPFMGSGTCGVAAISLGRRFVGIEIEQTYFDIAERRIREAMEQTALFDPAPTVTETKLFAEDVA